MAIFDLAYRIVDRNEGGYNFDPEDAGGETYRGIARNFFPNWKGWTVIDFYKATYGPIPKNARLTLIYPPGAWVDNQLVPAFYHGLWQHSRASEIVDQKLANIYFDFFVLHSKAVRAMQESLNVLGFRVTVDNIMGSQTLKAINAAQPDKLHDTYKLRRKAYHDERNTSKFYEDWIVRNNKFPTLIQAGNTKFFWVGGLVAVAVGLWLHSEHLDNRLKLGDHD